MSTISSHDGSGSFVHDVPTSVPFSPSNLSLMSGGFSVSGSGSVSARVAAQDARLLSHATSTATIAARSILASGGDSTTALKTAKAAAQSVLLGAQGGGLGNGPKGILKRRKIKKQAEVMASMALVSAFDSLGRSEWNDAVIRDDGSRHSRQSDIYCDDFDRKDHPPVGGFARLSKALTPRLPPKPSVVKSLSVTSPSGSSPLKLEEGNRQSEAHSGSGVGRGDSDQFARAVAIRIETNRSSTTSGEGGVALKPKQKVQSVYAGVVSEDDPTDDAGTTQTTRVSEGVEQQEQSMETYDGVTSSESIQTEEDDRNEPQSVCSIGPGGRSIVSREHGTVATSDKSFGDKNFDPIIVSFSNVFPCFVCEKLQSPVVVKRWTNQNSSLYGSRRTGHSNRELGEASRMRPASSEEPDEPSTSSVSSVQSDELLRGLDYETVTETEDEKFVGRSFRRSTGGYASSIQSCEDTVQEYDDHSDSSYTRDDLESYLAPESADNSEMKQGSSNSSSNSNSNNNNRWTSSKSRSRGG